MTAPKRIGPEQVRLSLSFSYRCTLSFMGRGARPKRRWANDRRRKKKEREKRQAAAAAPAPARRR